MSALIESMNANITLMARFSGSANPIQAIEDETSKHLQELSELIRPFDPFQLIEIARITYLPLAQAGKVLPETGEASAALVELLALVATVSQRHGAQTHRSFEFQEATQAIVAAKPILEHLLQLSQIKSFHETDSEDKLATISVLIRASEVLVRNPAYPLMAINTNKHLFDDNATIRGRLVSDLGFDASDAHTVLASIHKLQSMGMAKRAAKMNESRLVATSAVDSGAPSKQHLERALQDIKELLEPTGQNATVSLDQIVADTGLSSEVIKSVTKQFTFDPTGTTAAAVLRDFTKGNNPLRLRPLLQLDATDFLLPHDALNSIAVRENFEAFLKATNLKDVYAEHKGNHLEERARAAFQKLLPNADVRDAYLYYVPDNEAELTAADPSKYSKRVEGDHLLLLDDVAIIVEDKSNAFSTRARGGSSGRIKGDLTSIITNASKQAERVRNQIDADGGLRMHGGEWLDLRHIREVHTIAVSLDDISSVLTATTELVRAEILPSVNIPWTVTLHDLELIAQLTEEPATFLLYLQRRRRADFSLMFNASDELDLYLHYCDGGLWIEPDPADLRDLYPYLPPPTKSETARFESQHPALITSQTDRLDRWYYSENGPDGIPSVSESVKPIKADSPMSSLVTKLRVDNVYGWLSIGAMLLNASDETQKLFARTPRDLLRNPRKDGIGRSVALPAPAIEASYSWLIVFATSPAGANPESCSKELRKYLKLKKHQLSLRRGVAFLYDESSGDLCDVIYDGHLGPLTADEMRDLGKLRPASDLTADLNSAAMRYRSRILP